MADLVVGGDVAKIPKVIQAMLKCPSNGILWQDWRKVALALDFPFIKSEQLGKQITLGVIENNEQLYEKILNIWIAQSPEKPATLGDFVDVLYSVKLNDAARYIEAEFYETEDKAGIGKSEDKPGIGKSEVKSQAVKSEDKADNAKTQVDLSSTSTQQKEPRVQLDQRELDFITSVNPFDVQITFPQALEKFSDDGYKLPRNYKGLALVINITEFNNSNRSRKGAVNDSKYMRDLWEGLKYKVVTYEGRITAQDTRKIVSEFIEKILEDEDEVKSIVVFIGSHGEFGLIETSCGKAINVYNDLIYQFTNLEALNGKPKFFIVNACQHFPRTGRDGPEDEMDGEDLIDVPVKDTMICFSTLPGKESKRDVYLGSWYINCLTRVIMQNAYKMDLENMLNLAQRMMRSIATDETMGQVPYHQPILMKKLYFNLPKA